MLYDDEAGSRAKLDDGRRNVVDDGGSQSLEGLVEQDESARRHEHPSNRYHLSLAARQVLRLRVAALAQPRKQFVDLLGRRPAPTHGEPQIFRNGQVWEEPAAFWDNRN